MVVFRVIGWVVVRLVCMVGRVKVVIWLVLFVVS